MNGNAALKTSPFKSQVRRTVCLLVTALALAACAKGPREPEGSSSPLRVRLMTGKQYSETLANIFGPDVSASVAAPLPPLTRTDGLLESGAAFIGVTSDQLQQIHETASFVAAKVVDEQHRDFLIPCKPASDKAADVACATTFLRQGGRLWDRRPLGDAKLTPPAAAARAAPDQQKDFYPRIGDLFTTRSTFMSMNLAAVYGVPSGNGWRPYEFPEGSPRAGLLMQVAFLAAHAHPARSSATRRGKALREVFLCQKVPTPPPNVDFSKLDDPDPSLKTARDRLHVHATNASCAGCHKIMDPMGLALEHFDGAGAYRATEQGAPLATRGALDGKAFNDADGSSRALHDHPALPSCLVNRAYSYATT